MVYSGDDRSCRTVPYAVEARKGSTGTQAMTIVHAQMNTCLASMPRQLGCPKYYDVPQPVYTGENAYYGMARGFRGEQNGLSAPGFDAGAKVVVEDGKAYLEINLPQTPRCSESGFAGTATLGMPRITEELYENPDGTPITLDHDLTGAKRSECPMIGPVEALKEGHNRILVWA